MSLNNSLLNWQPMEFTHYLITGVMCSCLRERESSFTAAFWMRCNLESSLSERPCTIALQLSSLEVTNACKSFFSTILIEVMPQFSYFPDRKGGIAADDIYMVGHIVSVSSKITPRSLTEDDGETK